MTFHQLTYVVEISKCGSIKMCIRDSLCAGSAFRGSGRLPGPRSGRAGGALLFDAPPASRPPGLYPSCGLKRLGWAVCSGPDGGGAGRHRASPTPVSRGKGFPVSAFGSPSRASLQLCAELTKFLSALRSEEVPPEPPASHRIRWQELRPSGHILLSRLF